MHAGLSGVAAQRENRNTNTPRRFPETHAFADSARARRVHRAALTRNRVAAAGFLQNPRSAPRHDHL